MVWCHGLAVSGILDYESYRTPVIEAGFVVREKEWVELMEQQLNEHLVKRSRDLIVRVGMKIPYGFEITTYEPEPHGKVIKYETDLVVLESDENDHWKPRLIIECKIKTINTHESITYSQKASNHKSVHPYLRYGIILGHRGSLPLPGRLIRHGANFDFMMSFSDLVPSQNEITDFVRVIRHEIEASQTLENLYYQSRKQSRLRYTLFHRRLVVG